MIQVLGAQITIMTLQHSTDTWLIFATSFCLLTTRKVNGGEDRRSQMVTTWCPCLMTTWDSLNKELPTISSGVTWHHTLHEILVPIVIVIWGLPVFNILFLPIVWLSIHPLFSSSSLIILVVIWEDNRAKQVHKDPYHRIWHLPKSWTSSLKRFCHQWSSLFPLQQRLRRLCLLVSCYIYIDLQQFSACLQTSMFVLTRAITGTENCPVFFYPHS